MPTANKGFGRVLVTGAAGFLGRAVADALEYKGHVVLRGARRMPAAAPAGQAWIGHGDVGPHTRWEAALESIETVVHLAGLAHLSDTAVGAGVDPFSRRKAGGAAARPAGAGGGGRRAAVW